MSYGLSVYGENGQPYFSTEYNPFNYLGIMTAHSSKWSGSKTFPLGANRILHAFGISTGGQYGPLGEVNPWQPGTPVLPYEHVYFWTSGATVHWRAYDYPDHWPFRHFEFSIIVFAEDV